MASSSAVRPLDWVKVRRFWISSRLRGERLDQLGRVVELHQEELVLGVGGLEELRHRLARFFQLAAHAAAAIEDHAHRKRRVLARKLRDLLLLLVLEDLEVLLFQPGDEAVHGVGDGHRNQHQRAVHADVGLGSDLGFGRGLGRGARW